MLKNTVLDCFGEKMRKILGGYDWRNINEIRVRAERDVYKRQDRPTVKKVSAANKTKRLMYRRDKRDK